MTVPERSGKLIQYARWVASAALIPAGVWFAGWHHADDFGGIMFFPVIGGLGALISILKWLERRV